MARMINSGTVHLTVGIGLDDLSRSLTALLFYDALVGQVHNYSLVKISSILLGSTYSILF